MSTTRQRVSVYTRVKAVTDTLTYGELCDFYTAMTMGFVPEGDEEWYERIRPLLTCNKGQWIPKRTYLALSAIVDERFPTGTSGNEQKESNN